MVTIAREIMIPLAEFPQIAIDTTLRAAYALLHERHLSGGWRFRHMLVFDGRATLVGILSLQDLLRALMPDYIKASLSALDSGPAPDYSGLSLLWQEAFDEQCAKMADSRVDAHMTPVRHTIPADAPWTQAAYQMIAHGVHMLPVLDERELVGVVRIVDVFNQAAERVLHD
jgi:CBS domain-containing protein